MFYRDLNDHSLVYYPHDVIGEQITLTGAFSREPVFQITQFLRGSGIDIAGGLILEIGANIGTHTVYFFKDIPCSRAIAIEPDPINFDLLSKNVRINGLSDQVELVNAGASSSPGTLPFMHDELNSGGSRFVENGGQGVSVDVITVDGLDNLDDLRLIWLDVEGHETQVLEGALETLGRLNPPIYLEYTPQPTASENRRLRDILFDNYANVVDFGNGCAPLSAASFDDISAQTDLLVFGQKKPVDKE
ncbi:FkbM family methyltransferase [Ruegeria halocynthiae]|uniref:FkbM family methyltransferase n=1 Tax=Ruegeria halocynthiae TaxID=985054 RepID=UPI00055A9A41|nr:FkbM family methyltransferase [Ruegeria halocynthiae]